MSGAVETHSEELRNTDFKLERVQMVSTVGIQLTFQQITTENTFLQFPKTLNIYMSDILQFVKRSLDNNRLHILLNSSRLPV